MNWGRIIGLILAVAVGSIFIGPANAAPPSAPASEDRSLLAVQYIEMGMPAFDREWMASDFIAAGDVLVSLAARDPGQLPRLHSPKSGPMFDRIVATQNLANLADKTFPISVRLSAALNTWDGLSLISKAYVKACIEKKVGTANLVELMGARLRVCKATTQLLDELVASRPANDPHNTTRAAAIEQLKSVMALTVASALATLNNGEDFSTSSRARLTDYCRDTLPGIVPHLSTPSQKEALHRLEALTHASQTEKFQPSIVQLRDEVRRAVTAISAAS